MPFWWLDVRMDFLAFGRDAHGLVVTSPGRCDYDLTNVGHHHYSRRIRVSVLRVTSRPDSVNAHSGLRSSITC